MNYRSQIRPLIRTVHWQFLFVATLFFLSAGSAQATQYFNWEFESNTPSWGALGTNTFAATYHGNTTRQCTIAHTGSCSMKIPVEGTASGDSLNESEGADLVQSPSGYGYPIINSQSLYYRWWMRIDTGFSWGTGAQRKTKASRAFSFETDSGAQYPSGGRFYTGYVQEDGFVISECGPDCAAADGDTADGSKIHISYNVAGKADGQWHEYIMRIKPNTSASCTPTVNCNAEFQAYVDGVSVGSYNNFSLWTHAGGELVDVWGGWMVSPYFQLGDPSTGGIIYVDDVSTDNVYNSIFSGSDTTPPAAPTGLTVQ